MWSHEFIFLEGTLSDTPYDGFCPCPINMACWSAPAPKYSSFAKNLCSDKMEIYSSHPSVPGDSLFSYHRFSSLFSKYYFIFAYKFISLFAYKFISLYTYLFFSALEYLFINLFSISMLKFLF